MRDAGMCRTWTIFSFTGDKAGTTITKHAKNFESYVKKWLISAKLAVIFHANAHLK